MSSKGSTLGNRPVDELRGPAALLQWKVVVKRMRRRMSVAWEAEGRTRIKSPLLMHAGCLLCNPGSTGTIPGPFKLPGFGYQHLICPSFES